MTKKLFQIPCVICCDISVLLYADILYAQYRIIYIVKKRVSTGCRFSFSFCFFQDMHTDICTSTDTQTHTHAHTYRHMSRTGQVTSVAWIHSHLLSEIYCPLSCSCAAAAPADAVAAAFGKKDNPQLRR